jgi:hypothetical protein
MTRAKRKKKEPGVAFMTSMELAEKLGVDVQTVCAQAQSGEIPPHCFFRSGSGPRRFSRVAFSYFEVNARWPETVADQTAWARSLIKAA